MARIRFNRVQALPAKLDPGSFYYVENGAWTESYLTDANGTAKAIGNTAMISAIASDVVNTAIAGYSSLQVAATIADRDKLPTNRSYLALVVDATGDATVKAGSALYAYDVANARWVKVSEYESMDVVLRWSAIQGGPASTPAQIDAAVGQSHSHANKATLDKITEDADGPLFGGAAIDPRWATANW